MYKLRTLSNTNIAPWELSYNVRVSKLNQYIQAGFRVNLVIYEFPDTSTFRYRGYNIYQAVESSDAWRVMFFYQHELKSIEPIISKISLITIARIKWSFEVQNFINFVKMKNIPVAFDIDDRVFDLDYLPLIVNTLNVDMSSERDYEYWFSYVSRIGFTASKADMYISTNDYLSDALENKYQKPSFIIPNFVNKEQVQISEQLRQQKIRMSSKKPFTIGYFSGTPSHINDFKIIYKEILQLLIDFKDINLAVVGFMEFPNEMQEYIRNGRISFTSLVDFLTLQKLIASVDVNLVPLVVNEFTNCKSELKYFEAAIVNTITCASPSYTYAKCIDDGINGFLCRQGEWYDKIKSIYQNNIDKQIIIDTAYNHAMTNYQGDNVVKIIDSVYNSII